MKLRRAAPTKRRFMSREAQTSPGTWNPSSRTVEVIWTTGAPVRRSDWDGDYDEVLVVTSEAVDLSRLNNGAPFLHSHSARSLDSVLGVVVPGSARIENGIGYATVRFSEREAVQDIVQDVTAGIVRNVSVGYDWLTWTDERAANGDVIRRTITRWQPVELSAVPIGADDGAKFRARLASAQIMARREREKRDMGHLTIGTQTNAMVSLPSSSTASPMQAVVTTPSPAERMRAVLGAVKRLKLAPTDPAVMTILEDQDTDVPTLRERLFELAAKRDDAPGVSGVHGAGVEVGQDEIEVRSDAIVTALLHRSNPQKHALTEPAREFVGRRLPEIARMAVEMNGIRTHGMNVREWVGRALTLRGQGRMTRAGYHTVSDFPLLLADVLGKSLRQAYEEAPRTFVPWCRRATAPDFKQIKRLQLGEAPNLLILPESGEITFGTLGESREVYALSTYARGFAITRQSIVNDDLDAFTRLPMQFGRAAARLESDTVYAILTANAAMADGVALFAAGHANVPGAGAAPSVATIGSAMTALARQTGIDGASILNVSGRFVIVPVTLRTSVEQILVATRYPDAVTNATPQYLMSLVIIAEPRLDNASLTAWYMAGDSSEIDTLEYCYLEGSEGVVVETEDSFTVDGMRIKGTLDFAAKAIDWRGLYRGNT